MPWPMGTNAPWPPSRRIERALARIEAAASRPKPAAAPPIPTTCAQLRDAHQALRAKVEGAIGQIDRLLDGGGGLMANIDIEIAGRRYNVACRDGEEEHLRSVAGEVDRQARRTPTAALGSLSETRQLLFAALLIADDIKEHPRRRRHPRSGAAAARPARSPQALERLAARVEALADSLERSAASA